MLVGVLLDPLHDLQAAEGGLGGASPASQPVVGAALAGLDQPVRLQERRGEQQREVSAEGRRVVGRVLRQPGHEAVGRVDQRAHGGRHLLVRQAVALDGAQGLAQQHALGVQDLLARHDGAPRRLRHELAQPCVNLWAALQAAGLRVHGRVLPLLGLRVGGAVGGALRGALGALLAVRLLLRREYVGPTASHGPGVSPGCRRETRGGRPGVPGRPQIGGGGGRAPDPPRAHGRAPVA